MESVSQSITKFWICSRLVTADMYLFLRWVFLATGVGLVSAKTPRK